jgi:hypothetical protein
MIACNEENAVFIWDIRERGLHRWQEARATAQTKHMELIGSLHISAPDENHKL